MAVARRDGAAGMIADPAATLDAYFDGVNEERYGDVAALFAPAGRLIAPGIEPTSGREALEAYFRAALRHYPEHLDRPTRTIIAGNVATVEIHFTGVSAAGARIAFDAVDIFDFDEDARIVHLSSWYDSHAVRSQLRAAREAAA